MSTSLESFVNVLKRSGLVDEPVLARSLDAQADNSQAQTGENFAEYLVETDVITSWQAAKLLQGKHKGFFLGKYKLLRLLGKGGMSSVYLAEHVLMRRRCAIKVLPWKLVKDSSYLERFHREAQAVAALDHPNIVRAYDIDHEKDGNLEIHFLVMEYVEGHNLFDLVQMSGPLPAATVADYIRQGALGLAHAHKAGMVHRDVKPGNFIVDQHGTVKLMDLGLARVAANDADHSLTIAHDERVLGTADYLAPEQAVDSHLVDTRADLYSLGCTMYFLLTGRPPFNEGTLTQRLLAHQTKEPTPVESLRPDVPGSLLVILHHLMMKEREKRVQTAEEVAAALTQWLSSSENPATAAPGGGRLTLPVSTERTMPSEQAKTFTPSAAQAVTEGPTKKINRGSDTGLGNFLSSLSDVEPASEKTGDSSTRQAAKSAPAMSKSGRSKSSAPATSAPSSPQSPHTVFSESGPIFPETEPVFPGQSSGSGKGIRASDSARLSKKGKSFQEQVFTSGWIVQFQRYRIPLMAAGLLLLIVGGALIFGRGLFTGKNQSGTGKLSTGEESSPSESVTPAAPERPAVTGTFVTVGPQGNFGTLTEAVQYIQDNAYSLGTKVREIRIAGKQTLKEAISIDNSGLGSFPRGVKISGDQENPPHLQSPGTTPVFSLNSIDAFTLENIVLECRGLAQAIELRGFMSSISLSRVKFENIQNVAIHGIGLGGVGGQPAAFQYCSFMGTSRSATALKLEPGQGKDTREIIIRHCRFIGPFQNCVAAQGEVDAVTFSQNIFHDAATAIAFSGSDSVRRQLVFTNNTFHNCDRGIAFETGPSELDARDAFQKNLFIGGSGEPVFVNRTDVGLDKFTKGATTPTELNWTDRTEVGTGQPNIFATQGKLGVEVDFASEEPGNSAFLKPTGADFKAAAASSAAPAYIGAVAP